jgi:excinuclease ABC subunit C
MINNVNETLSNKLKNLPNTPGVYFHKDKSGKIIYIGKAARLKSRVRQYFQKSRLRDPKTDALVAEIADVDWIEVETELDALFLEAEQVRRYLPQYNILLRDDKSLSYVRIDINAEHPTVSLVHRPLDDKAEYFGPYFSAYTVKKALKLLRKVFPFDWQRPAQGAKRASLDYHIGLSPGLEQGRTTLNDYRANLRKLMRYLKGGRKKIVEELEKSMKSAAKQKNFEVAAIYRNQLRALKSLNHQIVFSDREFMDLSKDAGLFELTELLGLKTVPRRIEGFDISHMSGSEVVASMVVFSNGIPDKTAYRKFKMRTQSNDDFEHMHEVISRRFSEKNIKQWGTPQLLLIDGGKGQLGAAIKALNDNKKCLPAIGLAKQFEQVVISKNYETINLNVEFAKKIRATIQESDDFYLVSAPHDSHLVKLLQRIRDESHRFAVSYHSVLKVKRQTTSLLDSVPGFGAVTKKKLLKTFGSLRGVTQASEADLAVVIGKKRAADLWKYLQDRKSDKL